MEAEILAGVGDVLRLRNRSDVPGFAVEGIFERADAVRDADDGLGRLGDIFEEEQAVGVELLEGLVEDGVVLHVRFVGAIGHFCAELIVVPQPAARHWR